MNKYLSIDIGGTNVKYALLDQAGNIIEQKKIKTINKKDDFLKAIDQIVAKYVVDGIKGLAFCAPGKIERTTIKFGGALPFLDGIDFAERYNKYNIPVAVINDGKASVLAENWLGSLKDLKNCASITLGTGVGGGIIVNGRLINGTHFQAGEISFVQMDPNDTTIWGIAGGYCSAVRMVAEINQATGNQDLKDGIAAFAKISEGDLQAQKIFKDFCRRVAYLILDIQAIDDLQRIAISGGISAQPAVVKGINQAYDELMEKNETIKKTLTKPEIVDAQFKNNANIFGALYNLLLHVNNEKL